MKARRLRWEANTLHNPALSRLPGSRVFTRPHLGICLLLTSVLLYETFPLGAVPGLPASVAISLFKSQLGNPGLR